LEEDAHFCSVCGLSTDEIKAAKTQILEQRDTLRFSTDPLIGQVLDGKYQLTARLGEGGMGIVYFAHRLHIGDDVALKVLHQQFVRDAKAVERFRREARSAAMVRHPNVVVIHDFNEAKAEGAPAYIVMELVRGTSLRDILKQEGRLPVARAVALMQQICAGVGAGHRQGIVHRDLKPDNVIVVPSNGSDSETVKVLDFGLAKLRDISGESLTETGAMLGTPSYLPPEQCRGEPLDARSDVYSLGAMLYEMLTGVRPFVAPSVAGLIAKHLYEQPAPFPPDVSVSQSLEGVCRRALSKNPADRQADATAFSRELKTALTSSPVAEATPTPAAGHTLPRHKSHLFRWVVIGAFSVLIFAGAIAAIVTIRYVRRNVAVANSNIENSSHADDTNSKENSDTVTNVNSQNASSTNEKAGLIGTWSGTYGVLNSPATLVVKDQRGSTWSGVLEQGGVRVAFTGTIDEASRKLTFKETQVLAGSGWSLGKNSGELSTDQRTMSGTGKDAAGAQLGMSYDWSFSKH
jgi:serine/threonine protein kinase